MNNKQHYKLYKSGKLWITALVSATALGIASLAHADTTNITSSQNNENNDQLATNDLTTNLNANTVTLHAASHDQNMTNSNENKTVQPSQIANANNTSQTTNAASQAQAETSQITVTNPNDYPTAAANLVGRNNQGQPYYVYQIVNLTNTKINGRQARLILSVDPAAPQGTNCLYVTTDQYDKAYQAIVVPSGSYVDVSAGNNGAPLSKPTQSNSYRVSNTAPFTLTFKGKQIQVPASLSIKSTRGVTPVYGLGNQHYTNYSDKVDITPDNNAPAIEYIYKDHNGNYTTNSTFPVNVPVKGITGQKFTITNVNNYLKVLNGYYLTNQPNGLANTANGKDYSGVIAQFQIGKYYEKTLYNWDRSVSQTLIYELIDPQGTMNISLLRPGQPTETLTVPEGQVKQFSNGTLARNPYVPGTNSVQLIYADLGHIIPVDEQGNIISNNQPIYNNDVSDPHKAAPTASPDLTAQGWVLVNPSDAMINPENPGADTKVVYTRVVVNTEEKKVSQTVKYQYADGVTAGRPELPHDNVQTATFTHTVVTNPVTGQVLKDTWTPTQQFTAVTTPAIPGFWPDQKLAGGNDNVTQNTPSSTFVVLYAGPNISTETKTVTQTIHYQYQDGFTTGRPALPENDVQTLTFTATIKRDPETGEIISTDWSPAQKFNVVKTPELADPDSNNPTGMFYYSQAEAGSTDPITYDSGNLDFTVYYAAPQVTTQKKPITQTIHYMYADGETQDRPTLPEDNVQTLTFTETLLTNPFNGHVVSYGWKPSHDHFNLVDSPDIAGYYFDHVQAGSTATVVPEDKDTYYIVKYAAPIQKQVETKTVTQTIYYAYEDGITEGRPALPQTDVQELLFNRTQLINPFTDEVISDTWTPAQNFTVVQTPAISGFYYDLAQAGSNAPITHESANTEYHVLYFAPNELTETKQVTQTIKYVYADGVTTGRPTLPATNVQTLNFTRTNHVNPNNPNEVTLGQWTPASGKFQIVQTPTLSGFYYDLAQAGSDATVTGDGANTEYVVQYAPARTITDVKTVKQTIKYVYADGITEGRPALPADNVQALTFTHIIVMDPYTDEVISDTWTPAQTFQTVVSPAITGFTPNIESVTGQTVNHMSSDLDHLVEYRAVPTTPEEPGQPDNPENPTPDEPSTPEQPEKPSPVKPGQSTQPGNDHVTMTPEAGKNDQLPQTGNHNSTAIAGLGLLTGLMSLFGLVKRQDK